MKLNNAGAIVARVWPEIVNCAAHLAIDAWIIMPNHFHGLLVPAQASRIPSDIAIFAWRAAQGRSVRRLASDACLPGPAPRSLGAVVGAFKSASTREINRRRRSPGAPVWQRGYYERVIGDEAALQTVRRYIANNPLNWRG